ncbi:hypothetical protein BWI17_09125 [Betaproteobacteria bacterium GR16-43]|nr:hypothetical protein BWI17_09125 [Betaproteobacteria bacterium GR16-43]
MRVLLLGANGFIGGYLLAHLRTRGHEVVAGVRHPERLAGASPVAGLHVDLNRDVAVETWLPRLAGIDAVVNCAGVLQGTRRDDIEAIHARAPAALVEACERAGVKRFVLVSAVSADNHAGTAYASTKFAAEERLRASTLDWVVLRPSLVYAPGAYGGTALFRAMAALPFGIPLAGRGEGTFQPIAVEDVAEAVARSLETDALLRKTLDPVGPDTVPLRTILADLRAWLGFGPARFFEVPEGLVRIAARCGDVLGGPINTTALRQLAHGNVSDADAYRRESGLTPRSWKAGLDAHPAQWQDRWHARAYFVRPVLRLAIAAMWIVSAIVGWLALDPWSAVLAAQVGSSLAVAFAILAVACLTDLALGLLVLARWHPVTLAGFQVALILGYTAVLSVIQPLLWLDPFGALLKNAVVIAAILAHAALERER